MVELNKLISGKKFKVNVRCLTYNHSSYIRQTLNGFALQITNFPYICTIIDDASTDNNQEVIKNYLEKECVIENDSIYETDKAEIYVVNHRNNVNCTFVVYFLKENHTSKGLKKGDYIKPWRRMCEYNALCEGDDYWISPDKLQKQVDILDNDPSTTMVHTGFITVNEKGEEFVWPKYNRFQEISKKEKGLVSLFDKNHIMTLTILLRNAVMDSDLFRNAPRKVDYSYFLTAAFLGKIAFIPDKMGAYRKTNTGAMGSNRAHINNSIYQCFGYFVNYYLDNRITLSFWDNIQTYFYILTNVLFNNDKDLLLKVVRSRKASVLVLPFSYAYSIAKKIKNR